MKQTKNIRINIRKTHSNFLSITTTIKYFRSDVTLLQNKMQKDEVLSKSVNEFPCIYDKCDKGDKDKVPGKKFWKRWIIVKQLNKL